MGIIAWLKQENLKRRKESQARRLSEIQASLRKLKTRDLRMHSAIQSQLVRISELKRQLKKVKSDKELRFWQSLFNMCMPSFKALLSASPANSKTSKKGSKK